MSHFLLALESSCDETSSAVLKDGILVSNIISSQKEHQKFGGVVPEVASRKHLELINIVIEESLKEAKINFSDLSAVAVTYGPGLVGALLVGLCTAKSISYAQNIPLIGINHLEGHLYANFLGDNNFKFPLLCLVVSGGHTDLVFMEGHGNYQIVGRTRDDAAGEAFDKIARVLDLGYPGGPLIDKIARIGNKEAISLPRAYLEEDSLDFSFSGLKSAVINYCHKMEQRKEEINKADVAASFQEAVVDVLVDKTLNACKRFDAKTVLLAGGVAANERLRERLGNACNDSDLKLNYPPIILCTDNAGMIGCAGYYKYLRGDFAPLTLNAVPGLKLGQEIYSFVNK